MELNVTNHDDWLCPQHSVERPNLSDYDGQSDEEIRKEVLWRHGQGLWIQTSSEIYDKSDFTAHEELGLRPSKRKIKVAELLSDNVRSYYMELCIDEELEVTERSFDDSAGDDSEYDWPGDPVGPEAFGPGETWESFYGIT
ncbi:hypothetical protein BJ508DRAFT_132687 [Ascobolus immersus RN42]|uniref:Uncharacterized protein n=1 Tax=Ascobolus immersus RN42 TaxID=1160509 RepID=A0A3N4I3H6_ASCIM|nr:hypothetical protein BJ508DRAFT_132687 [Ascobolus immersus RN42]